MDETTAVPAGLGRDIEHSYQGAEWAVDATAPWKGISWNAVFAGAITAIAVTIIVVSLGSGIGLALVSPYSYSSPSVQTMTIIGAVWLVFAQAIGFATGGYIAGRVRRPPAPRHHEEVRFRDGANGFVVWAIGVLVSALILLGAAGQIGSGGFSTAPTGAENSPLSLTTAATATPSLDYYVDLLLRMPLAQSPSGSATQSPSGTATSDANGSGLTNPGSGSMVTTTGAVSSAERARIARVLVTAVRPGGLSDQDRAYLAQVVSAHTGLSAADAQHRVEDVVGQAKSSATKALDDARTSAAFLSFWTFMSLLFGAVCAAIGGMVGGDLRDEVAGKLVSSFGPAR